MLIVIVYVARRTVIKVGFYSSASRKKHFKVANDCLNRGLNKVLLLRNSGVGKNSDANTASKF